MSHHGNSFLLNSSIDFIDLTVMKVKNKNITCVVCEYTFTTKLMVFSYIHHNKKHEGTKPFTKRPICDACKAGLWNDSV